MTTRRNFVLATIPAAALAAFGTRAASAQPERVQETDPVAVSLGYRNDATKVDKAKYLTYVAGRHCGVCQLFQGKAGDEWGVCPAVGNKLVNAKGWCAAWVKKA
jgi:putative hemolysin